MEAVEAQRRSPRRLTPFMHLVSCNLTSIPELFVTSGACSIVRTLGLARNKLTSLDGLQRLDNLVQLDLSFNRIASLEEVQRLRVNVALQHLDLRINPVTRFMGYREAVIALLPQLQSLDGVAIKPTQRSAPPPPPPHATPAAATSSPVASRTVGNATRAATGTFGATATTATGTSSTTAARTNTSGNAARTSTSGSAAPTSMSGNAAPTSTSGNAAPTSTSGTDAAAGAAYQLEYSAESEAAEVLFDSPLSPIGSKDGDEEEDSDDVSGLGAARSPPAPVHGIGELSKLQGLHGEQLAHMAAQLLQDPDLQRLTAAPPRRASSPSHATGASRSTRAGTSADTTSGGSSVGTTSGVTSASSSLLSGGIDDVLARLLVHTRLSSIPPIVQRRLHSAVVRVKELLREERQQHARVTARLRQERSDSRHLAVVARARFQEAERALRQARTSEARARRVAEELRDASTASSAGGVDASDSNGDAPGKSGNAAGAQGVSVETGDDAGGARDESSAATDVGSASEVAGVYSMLREAHEALVETNRHLRRDAEAAKAAHAAETAQLRRNFNELRRRYEAALQRGPQPPP